MIIIHDVRTITLQDLRDEASWNGASWRSALMYTEAADLVCAEACAERYGIPCILRVSSYPI